METRDSARKNISPKNIFNHGFSPRTLISGELEVISDKQIIYLELFDSGFKKFLGRNESYGKKIIVSDLHLPKGSLIRVHLKDSRNKIYKSNQLSLNIFDPEVNPL